jgi:spore coat protein X
MEQEKKKWRALDHCSRNNNEDATFLQNGDQIIKNLQKSKELIEIRDSENITVQSTDTQAAVSLQVGLQAAIAAVISITVGDTDRSKAVSQDIFQFIQAKQVNNQKTIILKSKDVTVTTTDTDISVNIQALLQILIAVVVRLDVL